MKILVFRPDQLGDVILATPVFENLKNNYPDAEIISLTGTWAKKIIDNNPFIDKKIYYDYAFFNRDKKYKIHQIILNIFKLILIVRKEKIDIFVDLKSHLKSLLICYCSGAKIKVGKSNGLRGFFLNHKIPFNSNKYELDNNLNVISTFCKIKSSKICIYPGNNEKKKLNKIKANFFDHKLSIFPYAPSPIKRIPYHYWENIIEFLNKNKISVYMLGGVDATKFSEKINFDKKLNKSFIGKLSIYETYLRLNQTKYCISLDTFGSHLSTAADIPKLIIYTYANPHQWSSKQGAKTLIIHKKFDCFPCKVPFDMTVCDYKNRCVDSITYDEFEKKVLELIS